MTIGIRANHSSDMVGCASTDSWCPSNLYYPYGYSPPENTPQTPPIFHYVQPPPSQSHLTAHTPYLVATQQPLYKTLPQTANNYYFDSHPSQASLVTQLLPTGSLLQQPEMYTPQVFDGMPERVLAANSSGIEATRQWSALSTEYWETLYPGWKYDQNTGQWYRLNGFAATTSVEGSFATTVRNETTEVSHLQQISPSDEGIVPQNGTTERVITWTQVPKSNNGYPSHMHFDPKYPGWYYDTSAQEWCSLATYIPSTQQAVQSETPMWMSDATHNQIVDKCQKIMQTLETMNEICKGIYSKPVSLSPPISPRNSVVDNNSARNENAENDSVSVFSGNVAFMGCGDATDGVEWVRRKGDSENWGVLEERVEEEGVAKEKGEVEDVENNDSADSMCMFGYALKMFDEIPERQPAESPSHMFDGNPERVLEVGTHEFDGSVETKYEENHKLDEFGGNDVGLLAEQFEEKSLEPQISVTSSVDCVPHELGKYLAKLKDINYSADDAELGEIKEMEVKSVEADELTDSSVMVQQDVIDSPKDFGQKSDTVALDADVCELAKVEAGIEVGAVNEKPEEQTQPELVEDGESIIAGIADGATVEPEPSGYVILEGNDTVNLVNLEEQISGFRISTELNGNSDGNQCNRMVMQDPSYEGFQFDYNGSVVEPKVRNLACLVTENKCELATKNLELEDVESEVLSATTGTILEMESSNGLSGCHPNAAISRMKIEFGTFDSAELPSKSGGVDILPSSQISNGDIENSWKANSKMNSLGSGILADINFTYGIQYCSDMHAKGATAAESKVPSGSVNGRPASLLECSSDDSVNGQTLGVVAKSNPFQYLVKFPRFDDNKLREQKKNVHLLVVEKTTQRDDIRREVKMKRAKLQSINDKFEVTKSEERAAKRSVKAKRQEIDSIQDGLIKVKNSVSVIDITNRISHMEHMIEHETNPLKEEKQLLHEINSLKKLRDQISSNVCSENDVSLAYSQVEPMEIQLKALKRKLGDLKVKVSNAEAAVMPLGKEYNGESKKLRELQAQFRVANDVRRGAYTDFSSLQKQLYEKSKQSGRHIVVGAEELLLEICVRDYQGDLMGGVKIVMFDQVVSFSAIVLEKSSHVVISKSPNKHNSSYMEVLRKTICKVFFNYILEDKDVLKKERLSQMGQIGNP